MSETLGERGAAVLIATINELHSGIIEMGEYLRDTEAGNERLRSERDFETDRAEGFRSCHLKDQATITRVLEAIRDLGDSLTKDARGQLLAAVYISPDQELTEADVRRGQEIWAELSREAGVPL